MNPNTIGQLVDHTRNNGPTRVRHNGTTYEVKVWDTFSPDAEEEDA